MSTFATFVSPGTTFAPIAASSPAPGGRFVDEPVRWTGVPPTTTINAFATGAVSFVGSGTGQGIPDDDSSGWTLFELSPLPQMAPAAFKTIPGGLPVFLVLVRGSGAAGPSQDDCLAAGAKFVTAPTGGVSTAYFGVVFQDRICRDPLTWAQAIAGTGACDSGWTQMVTDLGSLCGAHKLYVLDHVGRPLTTGGVSIAIDGGEVTDVTLTHTSDGDTGKLVSDGSHATVTFRTGVNPIVASVDSDGGAFQASLVLPAGSHLAQVLDADQWYGVPDSGVTAVQRWNPNSNVEPFVEGNPYFAKLVEDLRTAKPGGAVELSGWAFVKGSQTDPTIDWPLVPGQDDTTLLNLVNELSGAGVNMKFLVNQFLQFDSPSLDDFPELVGILFGIYGALMPLEIYNVIATDPAGFCVAFLAITAAGVILNTSVPEGLLKTIVEYSKDTVPALNAAHPGIATWTPYPAAFADNPLVHQPFELAGHTIDDLHHSGVYHQKYVNIKTASGAYVSFLGGIDINSDRVDSTLHRAIHPFHDVQVRITGSATKDVIQSFAERLAFHEPSATPPISTPDTVPDAGSHLVQIARTYYKPAAGTAPPPLPAHGESTTANTIKAAIAQAHDFIYIEDQYFTPPDDYVKALLDAAQREPIVRALFITCPFQTDQPYGGIRRSSVISALQTAWGTRLSVGTPLRRFLHPTPALITNLGRMRLTTSMKATDWQTTVGPNAHLPEPPFWAFVGNELMLVHAKVGASTITGDGTTTQTVEVCRAGGGPSWGANQIAHAEGTPVICVQVPGIYVHAKVMIIDDIFLYAGSSNINRRGLYHDGELNSFTIPQHLKGDPKNPARILRCRLMAEHLGLPPEMGISLFTDPLSALPYFQRPWYVGSRRQPLSFFGSLPPDIGLGTSDTIGGQLLKLAIGIGVDTLKTELWRTLVDPTTTLEPLPRHDGPEYP